MHILLFWNLVANQQNKLENENNSSGNSASSFFLLHLSLKQKTGSKEYDITCIW